MVDIDQFCMGQATRGNSKALKRLYDHYAPFVWRIVYRTIGSNKHDAQEVVQDTFLRIYRSLKSFTGASSPGTWIYRITLNASLGFLANNRRRQETILPLHDDLPGRIPGPDEYDTREFADKILDMLKPHDRFLLTAKEVDGLTYDTLAEIFGKTSSSLRTRIFRLKKKVQGRFENEWTRRKAA